LARFNIGGYTRYNAQRAIRGRAPIRPSTFKALEELGIFTSDLEAWVATSTVVQAAKLAKAAEVKDYWVSIAPVRGDKDPKESKEPTAYETNVEGDYKDSIKITAHDGTVAVGTDFFPLAGWLEYGSIHNPEHGYGARVLAHFGGGAAEEGARVTQNLFVG
jgi:hypothetical protein